MKEARQAQKSTFYIIPFIRNIQNRYIQRQNTGSWLPRAGGGKNGGQLLNAYGVSFWSDENVVELDRVSGCTTS